MSIKKVLSDCPLLDEIVYNCQLMINGIVLKDEDEALSHETNESIKYSDVYIAITEGYASFSMFEYDMEFIQKHVSSLSGTDPETIELVEIYARNNESIPEYMRDVLLTNAKVEFYDNYNELNSYYRMLNGQPDYGKSGLYLDNRLDLIPSVLHDSVNLNLPLHQWSSNFIEIMYSDGYIDKILKEYPDLKYLHHLGTRSISIYEARKAQKFQALYIPSADAQEVGERFKEILESNRVFHLNTIYSDAYKFDSDYYDKFIMIMIILQTFTDMVVELPEYIIRKDIFDIRTVQYVFESNGVAYYKDIPLRYQVSLVRNLNKLIKFKSTDKNIVDICSLFGFDDIKIFKYYILKDRNLTEDGKYIYADREVYDVEGNVIGTEEDPDACYDLKFIKVPIDGILDDYIKDPNNTEDYYDVTDKDDTWAGETDANEIRSSILEMEFNTYRSKYISIENIQRLSDYSFEIVYFTNILMGNDLDKSMLKVNIPYINLHTKFDIVDLFIMMYSMAYSYYDTNDNIIYSRTGLLTMKGFNFDTDLDELKDYVYAHGGYTLSELGVSNFQTPDEDRILTFSQLMNIYYTNKDIHNHLVDQMHNADSKRIYDIYKYLYDSLMIQKLSQRFYKVVPHKYSDTSYIKARLDGAIIEKDENHLLIEYLDGTRDFVDLSKRIEHVDNYYVPMQVVPKVELYEDVLKGDIIAIATCGDSHRYANSYTEYLKYKEPTLYSFLKNIQNDRDLSNRKESISVAINNIILSIEDSTEMDLNNIYSHLPSVSVDFIKGYINKVVNFFKSFKVHVLDINTIYYFDDKNETSIRPIDAAFINYYLEKSELIRTFSKTFNSTDISKEEKIELVEKLILDINCFKEIYTKNLDPESQDVIINKDLISDLLVTLVPPEYISYTRDGSSNDIIHEVISSNKINIEKKEVVGIKNELPNHNSQLILSDYITVLDSYWSEEHFDN